MNENVATVVTLQLLVHSLMNSRHDQCNIVSYNTSKKYDASLKTCISENYRPFKTVQRGLSGENKNTNATLRDDLHWLPVESKSVSRSARYCIGV